MRHMFYYNNKKVIKKSLGKSQALENTNIWSLLEGETSEVKASWLLVMHRSGILQDERYVFYN